VHSRTTPKCAPAGFEKGRRAIAQATSVESETLFHASKLARSDLSFSSTSRALIAHRYWTMAGVNKIDGLESFYKNLGIVGGFLLPYVIAAVKYSIDALLGL
jgi:hypothetical protein